jgi:tetratricopeptide (TPR) repeat protein
MPKNAAKYALHRSVTNHTISRRPARSPSSADYRLRPLSPGTPSTREMGLAYAEAWSRSGDQRQLAEAERLLSSVAAPGPDVRVWLARFAQLKGNTARAVALYESVLARQPNGMAFEHLTQLYLTQGKKEKAQALSQRARQLAGIGVISK